MSIVSERVLSAMVVAGWRVSYWEEKLTEVVRFLLNSYWIVVLLSDPELLLSLHEPYQRIGIDTSKPGSIGISGIDNRKLTNLGRIRYRCAGCFPCSRTRRGVAALFPSWLDTRLHRDQSTLYQRNQNAHILHRADRGRLTTSSRGWWIRRRGARWLSATTMRCGDHCGTLTYIWQSVRGLSDQHRVYDSGRQD
jgi:hypothetical protein